MNKKLIWGVAIGLIIIVILYSMVSHEKEKSAQIMTQNRQSRQWLSHYPQLGSVESKFSNYPNKVTPISQNKSSPFGVITNSFGIKDDVLAYILTTIPSSNESGIYAAIKLASYEKSVMLADNKKDALILVKQQGVAVHCLDIAFSMQDAHKMILQIDKLNTNTPELMALSKRSDQLLAWQLIGPDLSDEELAEACKSGDY